MQRDEHHAHRHDHRSVTTNPSQVEGTSLNRLTLSATVHCLTGCAIGDSPLSSATA